MKKQMITLAMAAAFFLSGQGAAAPQDFEYMDMLTFKIGEPVAVLNGKLFEIEAAPFAKNGRSLVPFRFLGESLNAEVSWDASAETAGLVADGLTIEMPLGKAPTVNGKTVPLDVPAEIRNGRIFVPLRFVSEQMGCFVQYDAPSQAILIRKADRSAWKTHSASNNLTYAVPDSFTIHADAEKEGVVLIETPNGSTLKTYFVDQSPGKLMAYYQRQSTDAGWQMEHVYMTDSQNAEQGYEMRFVKVDDSGEKSYLSIYADPLAEGSNVGEVTCPAPFILTDGFLLYQIMIS